MAAETTGYGQHTDVFFGGETWTSLWKYEYFSGDGSGIGGEWTDLSLIFQQIKQVLLIILMRKVHMI